MKKLGIFWLLLFIPACPYASIEDKINQVEDTIEGINASQCIADCNYGTGGMKECRNQCDVEGDECDQEVADCILAAEDKCLNLPNYQDCLELEYNRCEQDCDDLEEMCEETCGDVGIQCISDCVEEMEAELKGIDL